MTDDEVKIGMRVRVWLGKSGSDGYRMGVVESGPVTKHYIDCLRVWTVRFPSGATSRLTSKEMDYPDPVTRLADVVAHTDAVTLLGYLARET